MSRPLIVELRQASGLLLSFLDLENKRYLLGTAVREVSGTCREWGGFIVLISEVLDLFPPRVSCGERARLLLPTD